VTSVLQELAVPIFWVKAEAAGSFRSLIMTYRTVIS